MEVHTDFSMQSVGFLFTFVSEQHFLHCNLFVRLCRIGFLDVINDVSEKYGGPSKFWLGNRLLVYIDDPNHFEIILNSPTSLNKGASYDFIVESIGHGLITSKCNISQNILLNFLFFFSKFIHCSPL